MSSMFTLSIPIAVPISVPVPVLASTSIPPSLLYLPHHLIIALHTSVLIFHFRSYSHGIGACARPQWTCRINWKAQCSTQCILFRFLDPLYFGQTFLLRSFCSRSLVSVVIGFGIPRQVATFLPTADGYEWSANCCCQQQIEYVMSFKKRLSQSDCVWVFNLRAMSECPR